MRNFILSLILLTFPAQAAFAAITEAERELIAECAANVDPARKLLSPVAADNCIKGLNAGDPTLATRYSQEDSGMASMVLGRNSALLDLRKIVLTQDWYHGARALSRVMEKADCTLCDMGLGPKPETAFDWTSRYIPARSAKLKGTVRTWEMLGPIRTKSLSSADYGMNKESWNGQGILQRYSKLSGWAKQETDKLVAAAAVKSAASKLDIAGLVSVLKEDLIFSSDAPYRNKLDDLSARAAEAAGKPVEDKPTAADDKSRELAAAGDKLASLTPDSQGDYLARSFDNAAAGGAAALSAAKTPTGTAAKPIAPVKMTAEQEKALGEAMISVDKDGKPAGYLVDVMNETEAGKRTIAFYESPDFAKAGSNELNFGFVREEGVFGYWNPSSKEIKINSEVAEEFAARKGMTVEQMMKDKAAMKDLALYISPTFVHESEHQNQTARAIDAGIDYIKFSNGSTTDPYTRAKENLSNKWSAEHMIEYCSKNGGAGCFQNFHAMHVDNADKYMQGGVDALDTLKAPLYARIDSLDGGAAREFKQAQAVSDYLTTLENKNRADPKSLTGQELADMKDYRELMDTRFKWYTLVYRESVTAEADALSFRKKYGTESLGLSVPTL